MEQVTLTNMCMIEDLQTGRLLVQNRKKNWKGIAFPGGHLEPGESVVESVVREVKEETGLDIFDLKICGVKDWYDSEKNERYLVFLFRTSSYSGELCSKCDEGEVFWIEKEKLLSMDLASGFEYMVPIMRDGKFIEDFIDDNDVHYLK